MTALRAVTLVAAAALAAGACSGGDGGDGATATTTTEITLTTDAELDPVQLGTDLIAAAGATASVAPGDGAEARVVELAENWCRTALRSDVENADATLRYSLNEFVTDFGVVAASGEVQDLPLARSVLAADLAAPLAGAANELLCPEVERPGG